MLDSVEAAAAAETTAKKDTLDSLSPTAAAATGAAALAHIRVDAAANYYDIAGLRSLPTVKIREILQTRWSPTYFPSVIQEVAQKSNSSGNQELQTLLRETVADHAAELVDLDEFVSLHCINAFAFDVMRRMVAQRRAVDERAEVVINDPNRWCTKCRRKYVKERHY